MDRRKIHVMVYGEEPLFTTALKQLLGFKGGFRVTDASGDVEAMAETLESTQPEILMLDRDWTLTLPVLAELQRRAPQCCIVLWTRPSSTHLAPRAIERGVRAILAKTASPDVVLRCIRTVAQGGVWLDDSVRQRIFHTRTVRLTPRQSDLVNMLCRGMKNKEIAAELGLSEGTVKVYFSRLFQKLHVKDRFELAMYGLKNHAEESAPGRLRPGQDEVRGGARRAGGYWRRALAFEQPSEDPECDEFLNDNGDYSAAGARSWHRVDEDMLLSAVQGKRESADRHG